ncbi:hypothetical protein D3C81_1253330 [compost metagenome]
MQLAQQPLDLHTAKARRLGLDLGLGEVAELDTCHRVGRDQTQRVRLTAGDHQQAEDQPDKLQRQRLLQGPHQLGVEGTVAHIGKRQITHARNQVAGDG